ncbi:BTAD domain-containing putative transcriptional regulator [Streptomyces sp. NPDC048111]|uniref:AfsR/SARP family transcriptional regulator n=1 Tax=Streptomyces sp. NPDC048111 TaxID=3365500 RepID=UPI003719A896
MRFRILGPLEVAGDPGPSSAGLHTPGPGKIRVVLGALIARANEVVSVDSLIDELWGETPPRTALATLHVYVSQVRKCLATAAPRHGQDILHTRRPGYLLDVAPDELDLTVFERLHEQGRTASEAGEFARAAELLRGALELWRGPLLAGTAHGPLLESVAVRLHEARLAALELRIAADLHLGLHRELVPELAALVTEHPLREELHAQLMTALHLSERVPEALRAYARVRRTLIKELGVEPGPRLRALHQELLSADGAPVARSAPPLKAAPAAVRVAAPSAAPAGPAVTPWLPAEDPVLAGRDRELAELTALLRAAPAGVWAAVTGLPGAGKTALAVAAARRAAPAYPDGVLFLDLAPADGGPTEGPGAEGRSTEGPEAGGRPADGIADGAPGAPPAGALRPVDAARRLLRQAGQPVTGDPLHALRAFTAARRVLLVLDNARSVAQVRALLPTTAGSSAVVTGRLLPAGTAGMRAVRLAHLGHGPAGDLLAAAGPAAGEIARLCGRLPLALRAAALLLSSRPHWTGDRLLRALRPEASRLAALSVGELDVGAALLSAYTELPPPERGALRLLGLLPPGVFDTHLAAAVLGLDAASALARVESLADRGMLLALGEDTYAFPELLRVLAGDRLRAHEPVDSVRAATARMCDAWADRLGDPAGAQVGAHGLTGLAHLVGQAHAAGLWAQTVRLADALAAPLERTAAWEDWEKTHTLALGAARSAGDLGAQARVLRSLGDLYWQQRRTGRAARLYEEALGAAERAREPEEAARALAGLAELRLDLDRPAEADALVREALARAPREGSLGRYEAHRVRAQLLLRTGDMVAAATPLAECLALATALRDSRREAHTRRLLRLPEPGAPVHEARPGVWRFPAGPAASPPRPPSGSASGSPAEGRTGTGHREPGTRAPAAPARGDTAARRPNRTTTSGRRT